MTDKGGGGVGGGGGGRSGAGAGATATPGEGTITFEDLGIPTAGSNVVRTPVGQRRSVRDVSKLEWVFLFLSIVSILVVISLTIARLVELLGNNTPDSNVDATFAVLLLFNAVFILFYVLNGVFGERANELLIFVAGVFIVLIYCIINYTQPGGTTSEAVKLTRLVLIAAVGPVVSVMAIYIAKQYYDSRNLIFRTVGASIELQDMCQYMFLCESLLKFDLQLEVSMVILVLENGVKQIELLEQLVIGIGIAYAVIWAIIGFLVMRYENRQLAWLFFITSVFEPAYIIYKIVLVAQEFDRQGAMLLNYAIIVCGILGLIIRVAVVLCMAKVYSNFGRGLKEKAFGDERNEDTSPFSPNEHTPGPSGYQGVD
ncbi:uncharacterized protein [Diadema setosum]|uniref:uncharacterized protein n=1 Tax=Diadema setosum TaxID=31175 RepID=UPI003B3AD29F